MKTKKTFSQLDYYWMLMDQFKDQLTVILVLNLLLFFVANHWSYLLSEDKLHLQDNSNGLEQKTVAD